MNNIVTGVAPRFALLDALRQREVAVFGPSTPGQTRTPNEGNGTPERDTFFALPGSSFLFGLFLLSLVHSHEFHFTIN